MPLILVHIVVLTVRVKVFGIVTSNSIDPVHVSIVNSSEIRPGIVEKSSVLQTLLFFYVLKHPVAAHIVLVSPCYAKQSSMVSYNSPTEFRNVFVKVNQVLCLFAIDYIVEMDIFVAPFKVVNDSSVSQLFLDYEKALEKLNDMFFYVNMAEFGYHC